MISPRHTDSAPGLATVIDRCRTAAIAIVDNRLAEARSRRKRHLVVYRKDLPPHVDGRYLAAAYTRAGWAVALDDAWPDIACIIELADGDLSDYRGRIDGEP